MNARVGSFKTLAGDAGDTLLNVNQMRPYFNKSGMSVYLDVANGKHYEIATNDALLRYDEWKDIDREVGEIASQRLVGIADLRTRGLVRTLGGLGSTVSMWQQASDMTEADIDMSGITSGEEDAMAFSSKQVPIPIVHKDFRINIRRLEASRKMGEGVDTLQSSIATRLVAERSEDMLFAGVPIQVDGGVIYGYTNHPERNTIDMATPWDQENNLEDIVADVLAMTQAARNDRYYGPYVLYIPGAYEGVLDKDYRAQDTRTLRQRLMALQGISEIKVADRMPADNVVLVQMTRDVVDLAIGQDINVVQWPEFGGLQRRYKVMAAWAPRIKADYDGRSGIVHLAPVSS